MTFQPRQLRTKPEDGHAFARRLSAAMHDVGMRDVTVRELALRPLPAVCVLGTNAG